MGSRILKVISMIFFINLTQASEESENLLLFPDHVKSILSLYPLIHDKNSTIIHPDFYNDKEHAKKFHENFTLFFDPTRKNSKSIPESLSMLDEHYNILIYRYSMKEPFWGHLKVKELLENIDLEKYKDIEGNDEKEIIYNLGRIKKDKKISHWRCDTEREAMTLDKELPQDIETCVFLLLFSQNLKILCPRMIDYMKEYIDLDSEEKIKLKDDFFVTRLYQAMTESKIETYNFIFRYIHWYLKKYDVLKDFSFF